MKHFRPLLNPADVYLIVYNPSGKHIYERLFILAFYALTFDIFTERHNMSETDADLEIIRPELYVPCCFYMRKAYHKNSNIRLFM